MRAFTALVAAALAALPAAALAQAPAIEGLWTTHDGRAVVRIERCGAQMCGQIARILETAPGIPTTDANNPEARLRTRPLVGLQILSGFKAGRRQWQDGRAYDPRTGRSYTSSLRLNPDGSLRITGCVLFVCRSKQWTRAR
jgi:uncharacterized protein (DUF2147 family)